MPKAQFEFRPGGSFAPPLTDELLAAYHALLATLDPREPVADAFRTLLACVEKWWSLPESTGTKARPHASGSGVIVPLEDRYQSELWELIPYGDELAAYGQRFDALTGELRQAAFHLLWHVNELNLDREPITQDKLGA